MDAPLLVAGGYSQVSTARGSRNDLALETNVLRNAHTLWDYLASFSSSIPCDAIVLCCSYDLRVCDHACSLYQQKLSETLLITGSTGNWTRFIWSRPEAEVFLERALENGVPRTAIVIENRATNFGENVRYARALLPSLNRATFVTKTAAVLRLRQTIAAQWPEIEAAVTGPRLDFPNEVSRVVGVLGVINEMVGDVERILVYPSLGFQAPHELPKKTIDAWCALVESGFVEHCVDRRKTVSLARELRAQT